MARAKFTGTKDSTANLHQSRTLASLWDRLLPQLLNGSLQDHNQTDKCHD